MRLTTYLNFNRDCAEAFHFYEEHLGGKIVTIMTRGQMPDPGNVDPGWKDKVLHASMNLGETTLMGADIPHAQPTRSSYLSLSVDNIEEAECVYAVLSEGGGSVHAAGGDVFRPSIRSVPRQIWHFVDAAV